MKKLIVLVAAAAIGFYSCGKDNTSTSDNKTSDKKTDTKDVKKQDPSNNNQQTSSAGNSFHVSSVGGAGSKDQSVDFTWMENGKENKLSDYKGKVVLLNFWATWCGPCRKELPSLSELSNDLKDKDFKMIGVSVDEQQQSVDNFLKSTPLSYTVLHEKDQLVGRYMEATGQGDNVIPQTYIIDKKGKIVETIIGSRSKEDFLKLINKYL